MIVSKNCCFYTLARKVVSVCVFRIYDFSDKYYNSPNRSHSKLNLDVYIRIPFNAILPWCMKHQHFLLKTKLNINT